MNLLLFAGEDKLYVQLIDEALEQGHYVTVFIRSTTFLPLVHERLEIIEGETTHAQAVEEAVMAQDAVVFGLTDAGGFDTAAILAGYRNIIRAMHGNKVHRLIALSAVGPLGSIDQAPVLYRWFLHRLQLKDMRLQGEKERMIMSSGLDWTIVRQVSLRGNRFSGRVDVSKGRRKRLSKSFLSRANLVFFLVSIMSSPVYSEQAICISNG